MFLCHPDRSRSFLATGCPIQARFWLEWECSSVIPTEADHRDAMIREVEGPCVPQLSYHSRRTLGKKSPNNMPFPHPEPRKQQYRKKDIPDTESVVVGIRRRIVNITKYRNATDDVNPAKYRTLCRSFHDLSPMLDVAACTPMRSPPCQLRELNKIAARIFQHRNRGAGNGCGLHRELSAARLDLLVITLDVVGEEHGRGLVLLKQRLLIRFRCRTVVQRQLQLSAVRLLG